MPSRIHSARVTTVCRSFHVASSWCILLVSAVLLSLSYPNTVLPGVWRDHPPFYLSWIALVPLLWVVLRQREPHASWQVWLYTFVFYSIVLKWISLFGLLPWLSLTFILSLITLLAFKVIQWSGITARYRLIAFAASWSGVEWLRSQGAFGLSWAEIGSSQIDGPFAAISALGGIYLLSFLMVLVIGGIIEWVAARRTPGSWRKPLVLITVLLLCTGIGHRQSQEKMRLWRQASATQSFALIQPSTQRGLTPEELVTTPSDEELMVRNGMLLNLSQQSMRATRDAAADIPLIIWSESAIYGLPEETPEIIAVTRGLNAHLLFGAVYYHPDKAYRPGNAAYLYSANGYERGRYEKVHLVPFGEYVPLRPLVERYYTVREQDIVAGEDWIPLEVNHLRIGVAICFESANERIARAYVRQQARYLIYITNDAWFHRSAAVQQHFNHARFRALESGLPVIQVASSGISGAIAPDGHVLTKIPTYVRGFKTINLPGGMPGTIYSKIGWLFAPCCAGIVLLLTLLGFRKRWISRDTKEIR